MAIKKVCFSLCVFLITTHAAIFSSHAATFNFTGFADFGDQAIASLFGINSGTTSPFSATLEFDDTQLPAGAISTVDFPSYAASDYSLISFAWTLGDKSWSHSPSGFVVIGNGKDNTRNDGVTIFSTQQRPLSNLTIRQSHIINQDLEFTTYANTNASNINFFNTLTNTGLGFIQITPNGTNDIEQIDLSRVALSVNAVPLPAGIWLLGSAVLGFIGLRRRRKIA